jgi:hypothetical protein
VGLQLPVLSDLLLLIVLEGFLDAVDIFVMGEVDGFRYVEPMAEPAMVGLHHKTSTFKNVNTKSRGRWFTLNTGMPACISSSGSTARIIFSKRFFLREFS